LPLFLLVFSFFVKVLAKIALDAAISGKFHRNPPAIARLDRLDGIYALRIIDENIVVFFRRETGTGTLRYQSP
jgi:hypothetical protein